MRVFQKKKNLIGSSFDQNPLQMNDEGNARRPNAQQIIPSTFNQLLKTNQTSMREDFLFIYLFFDWEIPEGEPIISQERNGCRARLRYSTQVLYFKQLEYNKNRKLPRLHVRTYVEYVMNICHLELANLLTKRTLLVIR